MFQDTFRAYRGHLPILGGGGGDGPLDEGLFCHSPCLRSVSQGRIVVLLRITRTKRSIRLPTCVKLLDGWIHVTGLVNERKKSE